MKSPGLLGIEGGGREQELRSVRRLFQQPGHQMKRLRLRGGADPRGGILEVGAARDVKADMTARSVA